MTDGSRDRAGQPRHVAELVHDARAVLGEGPVWDPDRGVLWWVDILPGVVHAFDPVRATDRAIEVGRPVGAVALRARGGLVVAGADGIGVLDPASGRHETLVAFGPETPPRRMNDGKVDPTGAFWAGRMAYDGAPGLGRLLRLDPDLTVTTMETGLAIPNGLAWSAAGDRMYFIDTRRREVTVHAFDLATRSIDAGRPLVAVADGAGLPDGMAIDAAGCLWVGLWGGGCVQRFSPDGRPLDRVEVPGASQVSSCAFGGEDLGDLYITTARDGLDAAALAREPRAGGLYRARTGARGVVPDRFLG